jgi:hypothetical protein
VKEWKFEKKHMQQEEHQEVIKVEHQIQGMVAEVEQEH